MLFSFGFDLKLLGNQKHVSSKLENLNLEQLETLREAFAKNDHLRFRRAFAANCTKPYGTAAAYAESIRNVDFEGLEKLVKIVGMLLQKDCLFWEKL